MILCISKDFSETPGPRSREEGNFSGEQFLDEVLRPKFQAARLEGTTLTVNLDATEGYATSFLEAAFGGLSRQFGVETVLTVLRFVCTDEPYLVEEIVKYIKEA